MSLVTLYTFDNAIEAHIMKSKLKSEGINAILFDENIVGTNPLYSVMVGGIKLKIDEEDFQKAKIIIEEVQNTALTDEQNQIIKCPKCNSKEFYTGFKSMKSALGIFSAIISFLFMVFPFYSDTVYKCKSCNHEWNCK